MLQISLLDPINTLISSHELGSLRPGVTLPGAAGRGVGRGLAADALRRRPGGRAGARGWRHHHACRACGLEDAAVAPLPVGSLVPGMGAPAWRSGLVPHACGVIAASSVRPSEWRSRAGRGCQRTYPAEKFGKEQLRLGERGEVSGVLDERQPLGWRLYLGEVLLGQGG